MKKVTIAFLMLSFQVHAEISLHCKNGVGGHIQKQEPMGDLSLVYDEKQTLKIWGTKILNFKKSESHIYGTVFAPLSVGDSKVTATRFELDRTTGSLTLINVDRDGRTTGGLYTWKCSRVQKVI